MPSKSLARVSPAPLAVTEDLRDTVLQKVRLGHTAERALRHAGVPRPLQREWERQAKLGVQEYAELFEEIEKAKDEFVGDQLDKIAGSKDWKAQAFLLSKIAPEYAEDAAAPSTVEIDPASIATMLQERMDATQIKELIVMLGGRCD